MTPQISDIVGETARLWAMRVQDPAFDDWNGFTAWLEEDGGHLAAYEAALEDDAWAAELLATPPAPPVIATRAPRRWRFAGVAAAIAAVGTWAVLDRDASPQRIATAPGEHRTVLLPDGSRMVLNGGTQVTFDPDTPRHVELAQGEALFEVQHNENDPFTVVASGTRLVDAGTVFNVVREGNAIDVAVAHGAVIYNPGPREIRLNAGDALSRRGADAAPIIRKASPQAIGGWQGGQLHYEDAPLDQIARDLGRNLGSPIRAVEGSERLRFTGTLMIEGAADQVLARAGPLLGVRFSRSAQEWTMTPADGSRR